MLPLTNFHLSTPGQRGADTGYIDESLARLSHLESQCAENGNVNLRNVFDLEDDEEDIEEEEVSGERVLKCRGTLM